jgi:hypothetical protein
VLKSFLISAASAAVFVVGIAHADVRSIYQSDAWEPLAGRADNGTPMCGVQIQGPDKLFMVKWFQGHDALSIHMFKPSWNIPPGTIFKVSIQFSQMVPWEGTAIGIVGKGLELRVPDAAISKFLDELRLATSMVVRFPDGNEPPWIAIMTGNNAAVVKMAQCIQWTLHPQTPTQPYTSQAQPPAAPTQPFASQPAPPAPVPRPAPVAAPGSKPDI